MSGMAADMESQDWPVFIISMAEFDHLAEQEGQVLDGFMVHTVDREARTLKLGGTTLKAVELFPMERGTFDGVRIIVSGPEAFALHNITLKPAAGDTRASRGAQWKRENNRHRRAW